MKVAGTRFVTVLTVIVMVVFAVDSTAAKRGCAAFGHSCFGAHGKRMDSSSGSAPEEVVFGGSNAGSYLQDPQLVFTEPRNGGVGPLVNTLQEQDRLREMQLSPILRQWLAAYRASQDYRQNM